ncbi:MAG: hypothetical protein ACRDNF_21345 [Streptosporangiaceae bacterium]
MGQMLTDEIADGTRRGSQLRPLCPGTDYGGAESGQGSVPWEPGTGIGSPNVNMTLFNFEGAALPSIGIFQNPAATCERSSPGSVPCVIGG